MADQELDETKKLIPEDRIRKLKEIAKRNEAEIKKAEALIKQSEAEIKEESKKKFPIPEQEEVNIGRLFRREIELEQKVEEERVKPKAKEEATRQYEIQELRYAPRQELIHNWESVKSEIYHAIQEGETLSNQQMSKLDTIMYATQSKMRDGSYVRDSREIHEAAKRLRDRYKG